jgi:hypothetical protein
MPPTSSEIVQAYRSLLRSSLRAVQYTSPARNIIKYRLRRAFRSSPREVFDAARISNTVQFLDNAARDKGMEHRVVKNLVKIWGGERHQWASRSKPILARHRRNHGGIGGEEDGGGVIYQAYDQVYWTIGMLNESLGLCLR